MADIGDRFMNALQETDRERTIEPVLKLFAHDAVLERTTQRGRYEGEEGARRFWQEYLESTRELSTTFENVLRDGDTIVLEWLSEGRRPDGESLRYRGVSVLEVRDDSVHGFRTYYDSAAFLKGGAPSAA